jgi:hypothetical protein
LTAFAAGSTIEPAMLYWGGPLSGRCRIGRGTIMKFKKMRLAGMVLGAMLLPIGAVCANTIEPAVKADNKAAFTEVMGTVQQQLVPGGRYEFVDSTERAEVDAKLNDMKALFDQYGTVAQMDSSSKARLFTDQEDVNAILTRRDDRRVICKSERPIGSLLPKRTCRTYGEIERERNDSQKFMRDEARSRQSFGGH